MKVSKFCSKLFLMVALMLVVGALCPQVGAEAKAKAKTPVITVKKIDQKTAKKVHKQLMRGKAFTIRFKCSEKNFYKKFQKLTKKVAKQTDIGFDVFPICMESSLYFGVSGGRNPKQSGQYTTFKVTKFDCQEYVYGIKFVRREYKEFRAYIKDVLAKARKNRVGLIDGTIEPSEEYDRDALLSDTEKTIASLKELDQYLSKTKFRNLSGAMKARIALTIGANAKSWGERSMGRKYEQSRPRESFKALYHRTAYAGRRAVHYVWVLCKISAVFSIGKYDAIRGVVGKAVEEAFRIRTRTLSGKTRYAILWGAFEPYNDYTRCETWAIDTLYRCQDKHWFIPIKKINMKTQQLKSIEPQGWHGRAYDAATGDEVIMYFFSLSRTEW